MTDPIWQGICEDARLSTECEPMLASFFHAAVLSHEGLEQSLAFVLASRLESQNAPAMLIRELVCAALADDVEIGNSVRADIEAWKSRDPACRSFMMPLLYFKGFHALQAHRVVHWLWLGGRQWLAWLLQNRVASVCNVDIHPAAYFGAGIMIDHATGLVIGETARVGNRVSMLHAVTLGGCGTGAGQRHPHIGDGVLISSGAKLLGPLQVGEGAKIGAGSVVLDNVPPHTTVAGVPARIIGRPSEDQPALDMNQDFAST